MICTPVARRDAVDQIRALLVQYNIEVIYSIMNHYDGSLEILLELLDARVDVPIVRHYKEQPCVPHEGERRSLLETDGQIYINQESFDYFRSVYSVHTWSAHILDGDMLAERYMTDEFSSKLRQEDGMPHLLVAGTVTMLYNRHDVRELAIEMAKRDIHVHIYGKYRGIDRYGNAVVNDLPTHRAYERLEAASSLIHLHPYIKPNEFTREWSRYDAGLMHTDITNQIRGQQTPFNPERAFDINQMVPGTGIPRFPQQYNLPLFERMNYPYRYTAYLAAGLPFTVEEGGQLATMDLIRHHHFGILFRDYDDLAHQLHDSNLMQSLTQTAVEKRKAFSFDQNVPKLLEILQLYGGTMS
jgi:hypothetical protein